MPREIDLYNITTSPEDLQSALLRLRQDFDEHIHDGTSTKLLENISAATVFARSKISVGVGNDVAIMDGANATYRFYVGNANPALAGFSVTKAGVLTATGASISNGTITGSTIQTATTGARIVLGTSPASLVSYDANGNANVVIQTSAALGAYSISAFANNDSSALLVYSGYALVENELVKIHVDNGSSTANAVTLRQDGQGYAMDVFTVGSAGKTSAVVRIQTITAEGAHLNLKPIASAPASPTEGDIYTDTDPHFPYYYDGTAFRQFVLSGPDQTIDGVKTFGSFPVTPSSAPSTDYQVANKKYVVDTSWVSPISGVLVKDSSSTTTDNIAHGLGRTPKFVNIFMTGPSECYSQGSSGNTCVARYSDGFGGFGNTSENSYCLSFIPYSGTNYTRAVMSLDSTNITLTWTKTGSPTGNIYIFWEAFA